jgi:uncharacterized protein (DUF1330 family)
MRRNRYGAEVIASDLNAIAVERTLCTMNAIIKFPSEGAALACYNDPDYQPVKQIRLNFTTNCTMMLVKAFVH